MLSYPVIKKELQEGERIILNAYMLHTQYHTKQWIKGRSKEHLSLAGCSCYWEHSHNTTILNSVLLT